MATFKTNPTTTINTIDLGSAGVNWNDLLTTTVATGTGGYTFANDSADAWITTSNGHSTMSVKGDADFGGDVRVQGRSLGEFMETVQQRLNILQVNPKLEAEWDQLRELGEQYRRLERELTEKSKMWQTLKK